VKPLLQTSGCSDASAYRAADELVQALTPAGTKQSVKRGERIFSFGDEAKGVYLIESGTVRASLPGAPGRELVSHKAGPGSVLGLPSALCANSYQFDVEAIEAVEAVFLPTGTVNEILRQQPALGMQVMNMMCDELSALRQTTEHMRNCVQHSCSLYGRCTRSSAKQ
jgi:CRP/FNR family transcriptional regulator